MFIASAELNFVNIAFSQYIQSTEGTTIVHSAVCHSWQFGVEVMSFIAWTKLLVLYVAQLILQWLTVFGWVHHLGM